MSEKTIAEHIEDAAKVGVTKVSVDGANVDVMSIDDRIKADQYAKSQTGSAKNHLGLSFRTLTPGGCG